MHQIVNVGPLLILVNNPIKKDSKDLTHVATW